MPLLQLTRDYADHSTDRGYQFEFFCDRCGNGFISEFKPLVLTMAGGAGGAHTGSAPLAHDRIFRECIAEVQPYLRHCAKCGQWVCAAACWDAERSCCCGCASAE